MHSRNSSGRAGGRGGGGRGGEVSMWRFKSKPIRINTKKSGVKRWQGRWRERWRSKHFGCRITVKSRLIQHKTKLRGRGGGRRGGELRILRTNSWLKLYFVGLTQPCGRRVAKEMARGVARSALSD